MANKEKISRKEGSSEIICKKRGRKPKGGKIINQQNVSDLDKTLKPNDINKPNFSNMFKKIL